MAQRPLHNPQVRQDLLIQSNASSRVLAPSIGIDWSFKARIALSKRREQRSAARGVRFLVARTEVTAMARLFSSLAAGCTEHPPTTLPSKVKLGPVSFVKRVITAHAARDLMSQIERLQMLNRYVRLGLAR